MDTLTWVSKSYPNIENKLKIICVKPATAFTAGRSFSFFRCTKIYWIKIKLRCIRSTIKENQLNELMLLNIHKDVQITSKEVAETFAKKHS